MPLLCFVFAGISDWKLHAAVLYSAQSVFKYSAPKTRGDLQEDDVSCDKEKLQTSFRGSKHRASDNASSNGRLFETGSPGWTGTTAIKFFGPVSYVSIFLCPG